ncbi:MAG TPA: hypothetical protein VIL42_04095 [Sphingomicrobium sp.]|jgi:hypothetical protein
MSVRQNIVRGRSHLIFIAGLLAASAFILWAESRDPDAWGQEQSTALAAGAGPTVVAHFQNAEAARDACASLKAQSCRVIQP